MIKIYGSPKSSAGRVFWLLEELELKYETVKINMRDKEHKGEAFTKLNPNGKIPCLQDGEFVIWESVAINHYLCDKYKPELLGKTSEIRGHVQQWGIWAMIELQKPVVDILIQKVFVPEDRRDLGLIEKSIHHTMPMLKILENALASKKYIVGDTFTVADLNLASVVAVAQAVQLDLSGFKNIHAWFAGLQDRPGFQRYTKLE